MSVGAVEKSSECGRRCCAAESGFVFGFESRLELKSIATRSDEIGKISEETDWRESGVGERKGERGTRVGEGVRER